ncbi:hypothetical protein [Mogibacterium diversum]
MRKAVLILMSILFIVIDVYTLLPYAIGLILLIGACGSGGALFYLKNKKSQAESAERPDPDAYYREDDEGYDIPEL